MKRFILFLPVLFLLGCGGFRAVSGSGGSGQGLCLYPMHVTWTAPTTNNDGTPLTNLAGFKIYWGTTSHNYTQNIVIADPKATAYTLCNFSPATYYFAMTAFNTANGESVFSNEVQHTLAAGASPLEATTIEFSHNVPGQNSELTR